MSGFIVNRGYGEDEHLGGNILEGDPYTYSPTVEGLESNVENLLYPSLKVDLTRSSVQCRVDLVHCQEVVEHIEEMFVDHLLNSFACGRILVMTHALPGQGGYHHVNLQPPEYWIDNLKRYNFEFLATDTHRIRKMAEQDGAIYMAQSGMVFVNRERLPL